VASIKNELGLRVGFISFLFVLVTVLLVVRLFQVQIIEHRDNVEMLEEKLTRVRYFMSGRGRVLSRDGNVLAEDAPSYQLQCQLSELPLGNEMGIIEHLQFFIHPNYKRYKALRASGATRTTQKELLKRIEKLRPQLKREMVILDLAHHLDIDLDDLVRAIQEAMENCAKKWSYPERKQLLDIQISREKAEVLLNMEDRFRGFSCIESSIRNYPQEELAGHLVGYMGRLNEKNYHILRARGHYPPEENRVRPVSLTNLEKENLSWVRNFHVGVSGSEWVFNNHLRGTLHRFTYRRDISHLPFEQPDIIDGRDLHLTIHSGLQALGHRLMKGRKGAIVLLDIAKGDVLAAVSLPSYDPNLLTPPTETNFNSYIQARPGVLIDRTIGNHYPFGSVYKIITSVAALEEGVATPESTFFCNHRHETTKLKCLGYHTDINVEKALERSCNIYFYECALKLGPNKLYQWGRKFHMGMKLGSGRPFEKKGVNPNPAYKLDVAKEMWYPGDTCHMSIGQGYQLGTPLQAAVVAGMVSNPRGCAQPRFWRKPVSQRFQLNIQPRNMETVRRGLLRVVENPKGTAHASQSKIIRFAGKTGTADVYRQEPHAWFAGFAPYENPEVSISVIIENGGHGGDEAAPIAKKMFEAWKIWRETGTLPEGSLTQR